MFHTVAYEASLGQVTNSDVAAVVDNVLTVRNNHLILTQQYNLLAAFAIGSTLTRARFGNVALTQLGSNHIWPIEISATVPKLASIMDLRNYPLALPQDEEITIEASTSAVGPAQVVVVGWLGDAGWSMNLPTGIDRFITRATAVVAAGSESTWGALAELTFEKDLYNGAYSVVGATVVSANALAFRMFFPDYTSVGGKQLRPGGLVQDTAAITPNPMWMSGLGEFGRFHTFTPPQIQTFADAAGGTYDIFLDLVYLGKSRELVG